MHVLRQWWQSFIVATLVCLTCAGVARAADEPALSKEQRTNFLLTAKVVGSKPAGKGITNTWRLTLSDGTITHDAHFQSIDEHKASMQLASGTELAFVDSYKYNIAAYQLADLLGLDDVVPVYVERKWKGDVGSFGWWLPVKMDEADRLKRKVEVPDPDAWDKQMYKIRVLDQLVYDSDPNLTNVLITDNWKVWRIDFTRAFRQHKDLKDPDANLVKCDRQLWEKLKELDANVLTEKTKHYLNKDEVKTVMIRRDKIVEHFQQLITKKGEDQVLY